MIYEGIKINDVSKYLIRNDSSYAHD